MIRKHYSAEFKQNAVNLAEKSDKPATKVVDDLGIDVEMLRRWIRKFWSKPKRTEALI